MHSFLLIGQSNMAGRGYLSEAHEIDTSRIYTLRNGRWQKMFRPINPDRGTSGVSLAESFAEAYAKKYDVDVGLICCADGGTELNQWQPGEPLFDHAIFQAKLAMRSSQIMGVLWHQGESDCEEALFPTYQARLEKMMQALRNELKLHDIPFILGGLGDYLALYPLNHYVHINRALENVAANSEMVGFASAKGLTGNPDNLHFNAQALYDFGLRYFEAFEKLNKRVATEENSIEEDILRSKMELL